MTVSYSNKSPCHIVNQPFLEMRLQEIPISSQELLHTKVPYFSIFFLISFAYDPFSSGIFLSNYRM